MVHTSVPISVQESESESVCQLFKEQQEALRSEQACMLYFGLKDNEEWPEEPPEHLMRRRGPFGHWRSGCNECRRQGLKCEPDSFPCSNCIECGTTEICISGLSNER
ncbi:hypothetical protein BDQ12DRAFT_53603 [Crucibulum laeve]|uniref:Zn(2)-C6 fungal-type domain-containing protein n=1 Tax=Crucibulum laeve TaxID=68775 RepID=A0A5C3M4T3_9AGAR|nr:hypothetical protein BDQ12DRAFT_53603 [Crucibulum laeve]